MNTAIEPEILTADSDFQLKKMKTVRSKEKNKFKKFSPFPFLSWVKPCESVLTSEELQRALSGRCCINLLVSGIYSGALVYKTEHCLVEFHCSSRLSGAESQGNNQYFLPRPLWPGTWQYLSLWWPFCPVPQHLLEVEDDRVDKESVSREDSVSDCFSDLSHSFGWWIPAMSSF